MSQNLPKRSLRGFLFYVILIILYLRARTIETSSLPNDSMRPLFKQIEFFFWHTDCIFQLSVLSLIYARAKRVPPRDFTFWANPYGGNYSFTFLYNKKQKPQMRVKNTPRIPQATPETPNKTALESEI